MHYIIYILFLYSLHSVIFSVILTSIWDDFVDDLFFLILFVKLNSQVVLFRMDLIDQFCRINDIPYAFELVHE